MTWKSRPVALLLQAEQLERNLQSLETHINVRRSSTSRLRNSPEPAQQEQAFDNIQLQSLQVIPAAANLEQQLGSPAAIPKSSAKTAIASNKSAVLSGSFSEILSQEVEIPGYAQYQSLQTQEETSRQSSRTLTALAKRQTALNSSTSLLMKFSVNCNTLKGQFAAAGTRAEANSE